MVRMCRTGAAWQVSNSSGQGSSLTAELPGLKASRHTRALISSPNRRPQQIHTEVARQSYERRQCDVNPSERDPFMQGRRDIDTAPDSNKVEAGLAEQSLQLSNPKEVVIRVTGMV